MEHKTPTRHKLSLSITGQKQLHSSLWVILANAVFLVGVVIIAMHWADWTDFISALAHINPYWILIAVFFQASTYLCVAYIWNSMFRRFHISMPISSLMSLSLAKLFVDQAVPVFGLGGTALAIRGFLKRGSTSRFAVAVGAVYTLTDFAVNTFFIVVSIAILGVDNFLNPLLSLPVIIIALAVGTSLLLTIVYIVRTDPVITYIKKSKTFAWIAEMEEKIPREELADFGLWATVSVVLSLIWLLDGATLWMILLSLGTHASVLKIFAVSIISSVLANMILIPGGLGIFEGSSIALMTLFGIPLEQAIVASLLMHGFTYWLPMIPGILVTRREFATT